MTFPQVSREDRRKPPHPGNCYLIIASTPELDLVAILPSLVSANTAATEIPNLDGIPWFVEAVFEVSIAAAALITEALETFRVKISAFQYLQPAKGLKLYPENIIQTFPAFLNNLQVEGVI